MLLTINSSQNKKIETFFAIKNSPQDKRLKGCASIR